ncbi:MAG: hypothetical protein CL773_02750 [Chloroflexi bacterium]|nr:hypothetical protein [Chloroflexota bacterium]|tara:strand:+ start:7901 stop:8602 length:702 start_codon:yes stop_codon:yes gene_type:complete
MPIENKSYFELQQFDLGIFSIEDKEKEISNKLNDKLGMEEVKSKFTAIESKLSELSKVQIRINQFIDQNSNEINELNTTLYSGKIRNTKESEAIEIEIQNKTSEIESYKTKNQKLIENLSKLNEIKDNFQLKIFSLEEKWINSEKKLKNDLEILNNQKSILYEKRNDLLQKLDPKILKLYETFISKNRNNGISKLENKVSTCCKIELPNAFIEKIKKSEVPIICNCGKSLISE